MHLPRGAGQGHSTARPALAYSAAVAAALVRHVPDASAELTAAALLHDLPEFAPAVVDAKTAAVSGQPPRPRPVKSYTSESDSSGSRNGRQAPPRSGNLNE